MHIGNYLCARLHQNNKRNRPKECYEYFEHKRSVSVKYYNNTQIFLNNNEKTDTRFGKSKFIMNSLTAATHDILYSEEDAGDKCVE